MVFGGFAVSRRKLYSNWQGSSICCNGQSGYGTESLLLEEEKQLNSRRKACSSPFQLTRKRPFKKKKTTFACRVIVFFFQRRRKINFPKIAVFSSFNLRHPKKQAVSGRRKNDLCSSHFFSSLNKPKFKRTTTNQFFQLLLFYRKNYLLGNCFSHRFENFK